jgi:hypothetical protein
MTRLQVENGKICLPHGQCYQILVLPDDDAIKPEVLRGCFT